MNPILILFITLLVLILLYLLCVCPRVFDKPDISPFMGFHYAHRGLHDNDSDAPENSLPAFEKACQNGYGMEFDVQLSKDKVPVIFHDDSLKRMCGVDGYVWEYTLEELKAMRLAGSEATIPTLEETLRVVNGRTPLIIEYKMEQPETTTKVCELSNELLTNYQGLYCVESFHPLAVLWYKKNRPDIVRGQLCQEYWKEEKYKNSFPLRILSFLVTNIITKPDFIAYNVDHYKNISFHVCGFLGATKVAWTVRSMETYEKVKNHFDLFIFEKFRL